VPEPNLDFKSFSLSRLLNHSAGSRLTLGFCSGHTGDGCGNLWLGSFSTLRRPDEGAKAEVAAATSTPSPSSRSNRSANFTDMRTSPFAVCRLMCRTATWLRLVTPLRRVTSPRFLAWKVSASLGLIFTNSLGMPGSIRTLSMALWTICPALGKRPPFTAPFHATPFATLLSQRSEESNKI